MSESDLSKSIANINATVADDMLRSPTWVGESLCWKEAMRLGEMAARQKCTVLIVGEVGTGKRSLAHYIHQIDRGASHGCWVLRGGTEDERLLFKLLGGVGSEPMEIHGVGSNELMESDDVVTLLIEDVDLLTNQAQSMLLEILILSQAATFDSKRSGRRWPFIIATSHRDLRQLVIDGTFREDLFWRLSIFLIELAPLRFRADDIEPLVDHFLKIFADLYSRVELMVDQTVIDALMQYSWPGNIIELQNYLQRAVASRDHDVLTLSMFPAAVSGDFLESQQAIFRPSDPQSLIREFVNNHLGKSGEEVNDLHKQIVEPVERELIRQVMDLCNHTQTKAAARLGINRNTLYKKIVEYGLSRATVQSDGDD